VIVNIFASDTGPGLYIHLKPYGQDAIVDTARRTGAVVTYRRQV
jgi:hypothetical protein